MKTPWRSIPLQPGQSLALARQEAATLWVAEGEVLVQPCAQWIAETLIVAPPRRVAAPAALDGREIQSLTALGAATLHVAQPASALEKLAAAWNALRLGWPRTPRLARK